jgi:translation initiation factor 3 subunit D
VNSKTGKSLQNREYTFHNVTTSDDPVIRELAGAEEGDVFATDTILAALMACTRSVYSWDVVIQKARLRRRRRLAQLRTSCAREPALFPYG